ncbi:MAG: carboxypeptidase-like regulatory domain-containing protein, partial [Vicingaceae bacterium]
MLVVFFILPTSLWAGNTGSISGSVKSEANEKMPYCTVYLLETNQSTQTNDKGQYDLKDVPYGDYTLVFQFIGYSKKEKKIHLDKTKLKISATLNSKTEDLDAFEVIDKKQGFGYMKRMRSIEGVVISEGKKNEVIQMAQIDANKATNQGRQIYSRIPGLNIWESDGAGLQLGIGGRGLNPNRTSNFNTRQNGYDISADALGYPESYYS